MKIITILLFLFVQFMSLAQPENAQIEIVEGKRYYVHFVQTGNTLYGIQRLYDVPVEDIVASNPETALGLKSGQRLLIPIKGVESLAVNLAIHTVQPKETLYAISKKYDTSIEQLVSLNPGIDQGLNEGQEIKVPIQMPVGSGEKLDAQQKQFKVSFSDSIIEHTVMKGETLFSISKRFMVPEGELKKVNALRNDKIRPGDILKIPIKKERVEKVEIRKVEPKKEAIVFNPITKNPFGKGNDSLLVFKKKESYNVVLLMPLFLDKPEGYNPSIADMAAGFYMGAKAALDSLDKMGLKAKVYVHDSQKDSTSILELFNKPEFKNLDLIIGPFYGNNSEPVAQWCFENRVRMICPFATNYQILKDNPLIHVAVTSDVTLSQSLATFVLSKASTDQIIMVKPASEKDIINHDAFRNRSILIRDSIQAPKIIETTLTDFTTFIKPNTNSHIVFLSSDKTEAMEFMNNLNQSAFKAGSGSITVYGTDDWVNYTNVSSEYKSKYNLHYATSMHLNYEDPRTKNFHKRFRIVYSADLTKMAVQGFDVTSYFCQKLLLAKTPGKGLMNDIVLKQRGPNNGFENTKCFIMKQVDYDFIKVTEIND